MIRIEAITLEEAYKEAATKLCCSITEVDIEVIQHPSKGMFGLFRKTAVIIADSRIVKTEVVASRSIEAPHVPASTPTATKEKENISHFEAASEPEEVRQTGQFGEAYESFGRYEAGAIEESFYKEKADISGACQEIKAELDRLFDFSCFVLNPVEVSPYTEDTVCIVFSGEDSALLIGKEGYRYKAISYLLFNWINSKYGLYLRLEIAEFLKNQEENIIAYLAPLIESIKNEGRGQTKILDGVLLQIALKKLREAFSDKYVGVKTLYNGEKYIIVNDFYSKNQ